MNKKKYMRKAACVLFTVLIFAGTFWLLQRLLMPKYMDEVIDGALIAEYYEEELPHDVIFIGDCEVYENISPITLWEKYGITSYIRGSAQQLIWQSYYLLEETLEIETPKVVVFNVLSMQYNEPQKEAYNRMTLDGMKWSASKWNAIQASMLPEESMIEYLFPLFRYHSRFSELKAEDFKYLFYRDKVSHNGYYMRTDVKPVTVEPTKRKLPDYRFGETAYEYLDKITELCKENGVTLVLMKAPSIYPVWYDEWEAQIEAYAKEHDLLYLNFLELNEETGIDLQTDTYDAGLHLNVYGAEKLADYMGAILSELPGVKDYRDNPEVNDVWEEKVKFYYQQKCRQENK
ncbi:MAG: SGNH/GDSL hydrolase family protein [Lachnospiraceae bacterium]|nr:SGNH/GDSL hydrolase family protein [Lachnospiraceae bacterium]